MNKFKYAYVIKNVETNKTSKLHSNAKRHIGRYVYINDEKWEIVGVVKKGDK